MTTVDQPTNPTPPRGGEPDQWIGGQRDVYALIGSVPVTNDLLMNPAVTVLAEQRADGTLGCIDVLVDVVAQHNGLCASQARELAGLLNQGADLADQWSGTSTGSTPIELLANAFSSLRTAHALLRLIPGDADSYIKAAMDSIADAREVL